MRPCYIKMECIFNDLDSCTPHHHMCASPENATEALSQSSYKLTAMTTTTTATWTTRIVRDKLWKFKTSGYTRVGHAHMRARFLVRRPCPCTPQRCADASSARGSHATTLSLRRRRRIKYIIVIQLDRNENRARRVQRR